MTINNHEAVTADVDFLYELGRLRQLKRYYGYAENTSSVAEHITRVCFIALILAKKTGADPYKTLMMALTHDVPEARTGDVNPWQKPYVQVDSLRAAAEMFAGTSLQQEALEMLEVYEQRESLEARIVKDADMIEAELEMKELQVKGAIHHEFFEASGWQDRVGERLRTDEAKVLYEAVRERHPCQHLLAAGNSMKNGKHGR